MPIIVKKAAVENWKNCSVYNEIVRDGRVKTATQYYLEYEAYRRRLELAADRARQYTPAIETVMLCGTGESFEEVALMRDIFPGLKTIHVIDWYEGNIDALANMLNRRPLLSNLLSITLHHADLRNPQSVPPDSVHFAFANKLFDLYQADEFQTQSVFAGIATVLALKGVFYSFDYPFEPSYAKRFYELASEVGLRKVEQRMLVKVR